MRTLVLALATLFLLHAAPTAPAQATCAPGAILCAGEATQACGGPAPYGDGWDGFTGAWGETAGVEYGAGGWDRCAAGYWSAGAFVNMDHAPTERYQTVQARFDWSPTGARPCYVSAGAYGGVSRSASWGCPDDWPVYAYVPDPRWGNVLP
ncbi:MAG TPA: hypothetical protein VFH78_09330, partial [Candidatus Thermoplasmatota archaeon]|nr:hypothetical protein [Candidatus Thermoplasmatota archaeon]